MVEAWYLVVGSEWVVPGAWVARRGNNTGTKGSGKLGTKGSRKLGTTLPPPLKQTTNLERSEGLRD